jgi:2-polyprenyl-3-methyl-5-hydroxy-6-metoxy-1,4-benzoquinol methylase
MNTDVEWEKWGKNDPYYGVITHEKYRSQNLTEETKMEFFESGRRDINFVLEVCRRHFDQSFSPIKVLDFGCGVGRLVIPFAEIAEHVVGLDVSDSMLKEARNNCNEYSVQNVSLIKSDDNLSSLDGKFDLIHSFIVFQHIPIERGRRIFTNLLKHLKEGGICAIQITYSKAIFRENHGVPHVGLTITKLKSKVKRLIRTLLKDVKSLVSSLVISESFSQNPEMQMNPYNINELFFLIQSEGIHNIYVRFTDHGGELGVYLFFQKPNLA